MVELRKRPPRPEPAPKKARSGTPSSVGSKPTGVAKASRKPKVSEAAKEVLAEGAKSAAEMQPTVEDEAVEKEMLAEGETASKPADMSTGTVATTPLSEDSVGKKVPEIHAKDVLLHTGEATSVAEMLGKADKGVVVFTYPKASTPGCTTQACAFRDNYDGIKAKGWTVYGLSQDSTKANTGFVTKQGLTYELLCDGSGQLVKALGFSKGGKGTLRGVVVVDKEGVVRAWSQSGPMKTLEVVKEYLGM